MKTRCFTFVYTSIACPIFKGVSLMEQSSSENAFDRKIIALQGNPALMEEVTSFYRKYGQYTTEICRTMSDTLFNWAFYLNGGGLIALAAFLSTNKKINFCAIIPSIFLFLLFAVGIILIIIAAYHEQKRFDEKGEALDNAFQEFLDNKITAQSFIASVPYRTKYDYSTPLLEKTSFILGCAGIFLGIVAIIMMKAL